MKIIKFRAENFQKLKVVEITPDDNVVTIAGKCEQGKTTILDAIHAALGGGKMPEQPIRTGEKKASVVVDLGEMIVTRTFTPSGTALKIENKDGFKASKPQDLLDKIVGKLAFDPLEFARSDSKKQVEMLLSVVDLQVDPAKLQKISGVVVDKVDENPLTTLNNVYAEVMENRKLTNRQLDSAKKVLASLPEVSEIKAVSVSELVAEKDKLQKVIRSNNDKRADIEKQQQFLAEKEKQRDNVAKEIEELEKQLAAKREQLTIMTQVVIKTNQELGRMQADVAKLIDPDLTAINTKIANADKTNKQAQQYIDRQAKQAELDKYQAESDDYTKKLKSITDYKAEIVSKTKFPVPGLDFANGGVTYEKLPFKQASGSQTLKVSTAIGMALNPKLRVMLIDGAESLDSKQMAIISEMASSEDYQLWLTRVSEDEKVGIYIEGGEIKK
ncbi:myosin heavy subunit [Sporomusaceae bacterium BoRhaA]|uniref:AAA family ATPase n=1 Tax=Pelorhabdus rhamnosifermentans TaxID=2772457 RepID=UPI001C0638CA|nr:AAA family ATPase [Pelorhabdus rhamnosifermentans]MBU2703604.1 myosin heavy subunit [Pelorhabdus rhamnosifermentans]